MNAAISTSHRVRAMLLAAALGVGCAIPVALAASTKETPKDGKADAKAAPAATNTAPWKVELPKSAFTADVRDRQKYPNYTDPFFPKTERIFVKPKLSTNAPSANVVGAGTNTVGTGTADVANPVEKLPPPPKWYVKFTYGGMVGPLAIVRIGNESYNFRQGQTREVVTEKGPAKVTCLKITRTNVELKMAGEDEVAVLDLP